MEAKQISKELLDLVSDSSPAYYDVSTKIDKNSIIDRMTQNSINEIIRTSETTISEEQIEQIRKDVREELSNYTSIEITVSKFQTLVMTSWKNSVDINTSINSIIQMVVEFNIGNSQITNKQILSFYFSTLKINYNSILNDFQDALEWASSFYSYFYWLEVIYNNLVEAKKLLKQLEEYIDFAFNYR